MLACGPSAPGWMQTALPPYKGYMPGLVRLLSVGGHPYRLSAGSLHHPASLVAGARAFIHLRHGQTQPPQKQLGQGRNCQPTSRLGADTVT
jgi:hypothetical protein